jgi:three-Cys-motif partner protein
LVEHQFGGPWTEQKLGALRAYLVAYQTIFKRNPQASFYRTIYVDAFAGTGQRDAGDLSDQASLFGYDDDMRRFQQGSAAIALSIPEKFDRYAFIDEKQSHVRKLDELIRREFPELVDRCQIERGDANNWLQNWCRSESWRSQRAVVFLDPYGMAVEWATLQAIAATKAIDLWVLFPLGIGASRVLPTDMPPEGTWADRLSKLFGTDEWRDRFYRKQPKSDLFENSDETWTKVAGVPQILDFFLERMKDIFARVVDRPMILKNSRNSPMYALCFAAGNPRGANAAVNIATYLTRS